MAAGRYPGFTFAVLHRAGLSTSSFSSSFSSLVGRSVWRAEPHRSLTLYTIHLQKFSMRSSISPRSSTKESEAEVMLAKKTCTPCSSKELHPMKEELARPLLEQIPGWELVVVNEQLQLQRKWKSKNFVKGLEFMKSIAEVAETEGHHPDLHLVNWNDVIVNILTHATGGLTENDFILAAKINAINAEGFLRKSVLKAAPKPANVSV